MPENIKNKRGRPVNPNLTKIIVLDAETKKPMGRGRPSASKKLIKVTVQKSVKPSEFDWNTTKYSNIEEVEATKPRQKVNVLVIPPEPEPAATS